MPPWGVSRREILEGCLPEPLQLSRESRSHVSQERESPRACLPGDYACPCLSVSLPRALHGMVEHGFGQAHFSKRDNDVVQDLQPPLNRGGPLRE